MKKFTLNLTHTLTATLEIEAETREDALKKYEEGEYDNEIELDEECFGGISWDLVEEENVNIVFTEYNGLPEEIEVFRSRSVAEKNYINIVNSICKTEVETFDEAYEEMGNNWHSRGVRLFCTNVK